LATLLFKGAADKRLELAPPPTDAKPNPPRPPWRRSFAAALGDLQFIFTSLVALGTAFAALYTAYANDPSWGADGVTSVFALVVTAFAAVGGQSLLAGWRLGRLRVRRSLGRLALLARRDERLLRGPVERRGVAASSAQARLGEE
jgi:hypothetical protein